MRARTTNRPAATLLGWTILLVTAADAWALRYKPKPDETLSHVALIHYGSAKKYVYLVATNGIANADNVPQGKTLWIPTVWRYRIKRGDDLARLAKKYLKDANRADFLVRLNQIKDPRDIEVGRLITMPFLVRHRVQEGQNMVDLAKRYYFQAKQTGLLRKFNDKRTNALRPGEIILIPVFDPEASSRKVTDRVKRYQEHTARAAQQAREHAKRLAASKAKARAERNSQQNHQGGRSARAKSVEPKLVNVDPVAVLDDPGAEPPFSEASSPEDVEQIRQAYKMYADGEFELAGANLARVLERGDLSKKDQIEARGVLAQCLVAMERLKEAEHEFVRLLMLDPERELDPITTSPKVLEVFHRAKGSR